MLRELSIENLAVIERGNARFCGSFNVFTGETGAGKSVLIGGINAILGQRVSRDIVRAGAQKAVVTALFDEPSAAVREKLSELGFEPCDEIVLSREIFADGKSSAHINGRAASAAMLKELGGLLIDIHGQHDNRILMSNESQLSILDSYAGITDKISAYRALFRDFSKTSRELKRLTEENEMREFRIEKLNTIIAELEPLELSKGGGEALEKKLEQARNGAKIMNALRCAYSALSPEEGNAALELLRDARGHLESVSDLEPKTAALAGRLASVIGEADDISEEIFSLCDEYAENNEAELSDKMSMLKTAMRKYNRTADELADYLDECRNELDALSDSEERAAELNEKKHALAKRVKTAAAEISELRKSAAERLSEEIKRELTFLDMPDVRIIFAVNPDKISISGMDFVELMISANAGEELKPMNKIASGGELSRIMLAIKCVLAKIDDMPTLIFDEIDTGISGRAAQKVGIKLRELSGSRQVMCVTHLAQIAAKAECHLALEKSVENGRTKTKITELDYGGRVREIARIIDGSEKNSASLKAAEEMMKNR